MSGAARPPAGSALVALCLRQLRRTARSPDRLAAVVLTPVVALLVLGVLFADALTVPGGDYRSYVVAGATTLIGLACLRASTSFVVGEEAGPDRRQPVRPWRRLVAQVAADLVVAVAALVLVTTTALAIGWRPHGSVLGAAAAYVLLLAFYGAMICSGILLRLLVADPATARRLGGLALLVLSFVSNAFLPPDRMPSGVRPLAEWNPVSAVATVCRQLWGNATQTTSQSWPTTHAGLTAVVFVAAVTAVTASVVWRRSRRQTRTSVPGQASATTSRNVTQRLARASASQPVVAVVGWLALVGACVWAAQAVGTVSATDVDLGVGQSGRATEMIDEAGLAEDATEYVLVGPGPDGTADPSRQQAAVSDLALALVAEEEVDQVGGAVTNDDGTWVLLPLTLRGDPQTAWERVDSVRAVTARVASTYPDLAVEQTGTASILAGGQVQLDKDFITGETLSIPLTLMVLLIVFGAFVAAVIPVVLALTAVTGAVALSALVSHLVPDSGMTANMILLIGMAVGVDYSLFYLKREREERRSGAGPRDAIETAAATSGHAVVFAGTAVIVSLAGLYLVGDTAFTSLASAAIVVVAVAVVGSLTVLPALLVLLSRFLDRPRVPFVWRLTGQDREPRVWPALLRPSLARPVPTMLATVLALGAVALPARSLTLAAQEPEDLPSQIAAVATLHDMNAQFPQIGASYTVVVRADPARSAQVGDRLAVLAADWSADPQSPAQVRTSSDGRTSMVTLVSAEEPGSAEARDDLMALRDTLVPEVLDGVPDVEAVVGGATAENHDYDQNMQSTLWWVVGFVLSFNLLVMAFTFRSVVIGVITLAMNLLSTCAAFGVLVLVFQNHWADSLLGITSTGTVVSWVPLFLFVVLVGLSMDYHVFVLHRIHEAARNGVPHRDAVRDGIVHSAGVVTSAAVVMVTVFCVFGTLSFVEFKQLAVGLGVAVLLDVIVVRGFLLPATLLVMGRWSWWPGPLWRGQAGTGAQPVETGPIPATVAAVVPVAATAGRDAVPRQVAQQARHDGDDRRRRLTDEDLRLTVARWRQVELGWRPTPQPALEHDPRYPRTVDEDLELTDKSRASVPLRDDVPRAPAAASQTETTLDPDQTPVRGVPKVWVASQSDHRDDT